MIDHETAMHLRTGVTRAIVVACNDNGAAQTVDIQSHDGVTRSGVEIHQPFGLASVPPTHGATVILIGNGADPSDMIALAAACNLGRLGGLQSGETAIYAADGTRIHLKLGGIVEILAAAQLQITAPNCTITSSGSITLAGNVGISGTLHVAGAVTFDDGLNVTGNIDATGTITGSA